MKRTYTEFNIIPAGNNIMKRTYPEFYIIPAGNNIMKRTYTEFNIIPAGTKIVFFANAGMAGTDHAEGYILRSDMTEGYLDNEAWRFGVECAEHYGIYPSHEYEDEDDYDEDDEHYSDNIEGYWDIYNAEEHEGRITYGNGGPIFREIYREVS